MRSFSDCDARVLRVWLTTILILLSVIGVYGSDGSQRSDPLVVSIANLTSVPCLLEDIDLNQCPILSGSPATLIAPQTERSFWIGQQTLGVYFKRSRVRLVYRCGDVRIDLTSLQDSCLTMPYGEVWKGAGGYQVTYKALKGDCNSHSPGMVLWRISAV